MANTLDALKSGELLGSTTLKLACGLKEFPAEIITLSETLEVLDLSDNELSELPDSVSELKQLRIIFFANNKFTKFPEILAQCPSLTMIGFKSNQIEKVPENAFPPLLKWLILTDNKIKTLPKSIGDCKLLQKCALAGNLIKELPPEMSNCSSLELLRISANQLKVIPQWLFELPRLAWVAFGGNPAAHKVEILNHLESFSWNDFEVQHLLGEGASGFISKAKWHSKNQEVAIKVFKGAVTSDGLPEDEMAIAIVADKHENLVEVLGKIKNHPEDKSGLIMELIAPNYTNLGNPPNLATCTRDTFTKEMTYSEEKLLKIAKSMASVCSHLHSKGINHGDLYAHNIMINTDAECLLGDYGAATFYDVTSEAAHNIERVEVKAYGHLLEDVLNVVRKNELNETKRNQWQNLIVLCTNSVVNTRPSFAEVLQKLNTF